MEQSLASPVERKIALPDEIQAEIDRIMGEDKGMAYDPLTIKASLQKDRWWFKVKGNDEPLEKRDVLEAHIFYGLKTRAAYGSREQKVPSCVSLDGCRTGTLNERFSDTLPVQIPNGQPCLSCPYNQFGSGIDDKGNPTNSKFCGERRTLLAFVKGYDDPIIVSVPTMSCGPWDTYAGGLEKVLHTSFVTQATRVSIENVVRGGDSGEYGRAKFETMGTLPTDQIAKGIAARKQFSGMIASVIEQQEQAPVADEAGNWTDNPPEEEGVSPI